MKAKLRQPNNRIKVQMFDANNTLLKTFNSKKEVLKYFNIVCYKSLNNAIKNHTQYKNYYWKVL